MADNGTRIIAENAGGSPMRRLARAFVESYRRERYEQTADWLYRGVMLMALLALLSLWWQIRALIGSAGILPVGEYLDAVHAQLGDDAYLRLPTLLWLWNSDAALHLLCALGVVACGVGLSGYVRVTAALVAYAVYLSLFYAGQVFTGYQWDLLLIECLLLCALLATRPGWGVWLFRLLLLRFMFLSGAVKLLSGDPTWAHATALEYHFETQPLPTVLAWFAHHLPQWILHAGVYATFVIELALPWLVLLPRAPRLVAGAGFVLLEMLILLTGSYNFFNLLTIVMCFALLDDDLLRRLPRLRGIGVCRRGRYLAAGSGCVIALLGALVVIETVSGAQTPRQLLAIAEPSRAVNRYGLFAVMTTERDELIIEGSLDGVTWRAYEFPFKPGNPARAPRLATPHQPRLDWQMWFAALTTFERTPWMYGFADALLRGEPHVLALLEDPFEGQAPAFVRVTRYRYRFTTAREREATGDWWIRERIGAWSPELRLRVPVIRYEPLTVD